MAYVFPHTEEHLRKYGGARGLIKGYKDGAFTEYLHSQVRGTKEELPFKILLAENGEVHGEIDVDGFHEPTKADRRHFPDARRVYEVNSGRLYRSGAIAYEDLYSLPSFQGTKYPHRRIRFAPKIADDEYATLTSRT